MKNQHKNALPAPWHGTAWIIYVKLDEEGCVGFCFSMHAGPPHSSFAPFLWHAIALAVKCVLCSHYGVVMYVLACWYVDPAVSGWFWAGRVV